MLRNNINYLYIIYVRNILVFLKFALTIKLKYKKNQKKKLKNCYQ